MAAGPVLGLGELRHRAQRIAVVAEPGADSLRSGSKLVGAVVEGSVVLQGDRPALDRFCRRATVRECAAFGSPVTCSDANYQFRFLAARLVQNRSITVIPTEPKSVIASSSAGASSSDTVLPMSRCGS